MSILLYTTSESHTFIATDPRMPSNINLHTYMYALHIETLKWKKQPTKKKYREENWENGTHNDLTYENHSPSLIYMDFQVKNKMFYIIPSYLPLWPKSYIIWKIYGQFYKNCIHTHTHTHTHMISGQNRKHSALRTLSLHMPKITFYPRSKSTSLQYMWRFFVRPFIMCALCVT